MDDIRETKWEKILPFNENTLLKAHQFHAYMAGILNSDGREGVEDWLVSNSLRIFCCGSCFCVCYPGDCPTLLHEIEGTEEDCFDREKVFLTDLQIHKDKEKLINKIIGKINEGYYVYGEFNEFYVPCKVAYLKYNFIHDYLIIGYNLSTMNFIMVGYTSRGILKVMPLFFEDFYKAVKNINKDSHATIDFYKVKSDFVFEYQTGMAKRSIEEFINSEETSKFSVDNYLYGKAALENFHTLMNRDLAEKELFLYVRNVRSFFEHSNFFIKFIKYLIKHNCIEKKKPYTKILEHYDCSKIQLNLAIKYYVTHNSSIPQRIQKIIGDMVQNEIEAVNCLYQNSILEKMS